MDFGYENEQSSANKGPMDEKHIHTCIHTYIHIYTYVHIYTRLHSVCTLWCVYVYIYIYMGETPIGGQFLVITLTFPQFL